MISVISSRICYLFFILFPLSIDVTSASKTYDMEAESLKMFGEDYGSVLRRFRRTPEYLAILDDRFGILNVRLQEIIVQTMQHMENRLVQRVTTMVAQTDTTTTSTTEVPKMFKYRARSEEDSDETTTEHPVRQLDSYYLLHREMSTQERNQFRNVGFEMAGQMVHSIIKGMGPAGATVGGMAGSMKPAGPLTTEPTAEETTHNHVVQTSLPGLEFPPTEVHAASHQPEHHEPTHTDETYKYKMKRS